MVVGVGDWLGSAVGVRVGACVGCWSGVWAAVGLFSGVEVELSLVGDGVTSAVVGVGSSTRALALSHATISVEANNASTISKILKYNFIRLL